MENSNLTVLLMSLPSVLNFDLSLEFKILFRFCKIVFSISLKHQLREVWFVKETPISESGPSTSYNDHA